MSINIYIYITSRCLIIISSHSLWPWFRVSYFQGWKNCPRTTRVGKLEHMFSFWIASLSLAIAGSHIRWEIQDVLKRDILTNIPPCSWILKFYDILVAWQILRNHTSIDPSISYESEPNRLRSDPCILVMFNEVNQSILNNANKSLHHLCWCNNQGRKFVFVSSLHPVCFKPPEWRPKTYFHRHLLNGFSQITFSFLYLAKGWTNWPRNQLGGYGWKQKGSDYLHHMNDWMSTKT